MGVLYVAMAMCSDQIQIGVFCKDVLVYIVHRTYGCLISKIFVSS